MLAPAPSSHQGTAESTARTARFVCRSRGLDGNLHSSDARLSAARAKTLRSLITEQLRGPRQLRQLVRRRHLATCPSPTRTRRGPAARTGARSEDRCAPLNEARIPSNRSRRSLCRSPSTPAHRCDATADGACRGCSHPCTRTPPVEAACPPPGLPCVASTTRQRPDWLSRPATAQPADPAPVTMKSKVSSAIVILVPLESSGER